MTKVALLERTRRSTAGKRYSVSKETELEEDEYFRLQSRYSEYFKDNRDISDASESYCENDEDEIDKIDIFDSDFNDTEDEEEDTERDKSDTYLKKKILCESSNSTKPNIKKCMSSGKTSLKKKTKNTIIAEGGLDKLQEANLLPHRNPNKIQINSYSGITKDLLDIKRSLRSKTLTSSLGSVVSFSIGTSENNNNIRKSKNPKKRQTFTQEELLLEAVQVTEAENQRWLFSRKRFLNKPKSSLKSTDSKDDICGSIENMKKRKTVVRYRSCRLHNSITFFDTNYFPKKFMNYLSAIPSTREDVNTELDDKFCVITGKPARYKDPKSGKGFYDIKAFRVLKDMLRIEDPNNKPHSLGVRSGRINKDSIGKSRDI